MFLSYLPELMSFTIENPLERAKSATDELYVSIENITFLKFLVNSIMIS